MKIFLSKKKLIKFIHDEQHIEYRNIVKNLITKVLGFKNDIKQ